MKVGLIRGAYLSPFEMQTFEHLMGRVDFEAYHIHSNKFPIDMIRVPIKHLPCIDDPVSRICPRLSVYFNLMLQATTGTDYYHFGLDRALSGMDIAHTMETFNMFSWQALRAKQRYGVRLVVTVWENRPYAAERFREKRLAKYEVLRNADLFLAATTRAARCLRLEGADPLKIKIWSPGVNLDRFQLRPKPSAMLEKLGIAPDDFVFITVANLRWEKGVYDILHAFKWLMLEKPNRSLKLVFVGSGPEKKLLCARAERIGLGGHVIFSHFSYEDMPAVYNVADVFILASTARTSWQEQFGYVLAEAQASGVPILTTQHGSIPEVVGAAAMIVPPSDFLALGAAMRKLLEDPQTRRHLSLLGRVRAETKYDSKKQADRLLTAYESILS